jgi:ParB-like chromosome segregation protein Spo0J
VWRNRIVGYGEEAPDQLLANDKNWRIHPKAQQQALAGVLQEVGVVQNVIVNQRTGKMIDGHLRVMLAISAGQPSVPITYVDLDDAEEAKILATIDPLSAMAATDSDLLGALLEDVTTGDAALQALLDGMAKDAGLDKPKDDSPLILAGDQSGKLKEQYQVLVTCDDEMKQAELLEMLTNEGWSCRALLS